jgi:hypothetical protein
MLQQDAATAALIGRIRDLKARAPLPVVAAPCGGTAAATSLKGGEQGRFPEGVYRAEVPLELFLQRGVNPSWAEHNDGVSTLTFRDGRWRHHVGGDSPDLDCYGPYSVKGGRITLSFRELLCGSAGGDLVSAAWSVAGDGIRFVDIAAGQPGEEGLMSVLFGSTVWRKIA